MNTNEHEWGFNLRLSTLARVEGGLERPRLPGKADPTMLFGFVIVFELNYFGTDGFSGSQAAAISYGD
jgi:hypothetical protein